MRRQRAAFGSLARLDLIILLSLVLAWSPLGVAAFYTFVGTNTGNSFTTSTCPQAKVASTQSGTEVTTSAGTVPVTITSVDPAKSFLTFSTSSNSNRPVGSTIRGRIANATTLEFARATDEGSPPTITVRWSVVQYSCGVTVQRGSVAQTGTQTDVPVTPVAATDRAFLTWSKTVEPSEQDWGPTDQTAGRLTSASNIRFESQSAPGAVTAASWYNASWGYRKVITIDHTKVAANQTNFPMLVSLTDNDLRLFAQSDADDILFTSSDGTTKLNHEIESYTSASGALIAWVTVPSLSSTTDTTVYVYYGNASASSQQAATATWPTQYKSVWHLKEDPTGAVPQFKDSTSNVNHGTNQGAMTAAAQVAGKVNGSLTLDGSNDYISTANQWTDPQTFAIGGWFKTSTASGNKIIGFETAQTGTSTSAYDRQIWVGTDGKVRFGVNSTNGNDVVASTGTVTDGNWHHVVGYLDSTGAQIGMYVDGVLQATKASPNAEHYNGYWRMGSYWAPSAFWPMGNNGYFPGSLDEFRITNTVPSATWISTQYNNQNSPSTFATVSTAQPQTGWYSSSWRYRKTVTVDATKVISGPHTNFPVLVARTDAGLIGKTLSNGDDIMFTSSDGVTKLDHQIEYFNSATGQMYIWVRVPSLPSASNTTIYMYYGNGGAANQQNATGVWGTEYYGVWHLNETVNTTVGGFKDSSSAANHATYRGTSGMTNTADFGVALDGVDDWLSTTVQHTGSGPQTFTVEAWALTTDATNTAAPIVGLEGSQTDNTSGLWDRSLYFGTDGKPRFFIYNGGNKIAVQTGATSYANGNWQHIIGTFSASDAMRLYINGVQVDTDPNTVAESDPGWWRIGSFHAPTASGANGAYGYFKGSIDEVRVSNVVRSAGWIQTNLNTQAQPGSFTILGGEQTKAITTPPTIWWQLVEFTNAADISVQRGTTSLTGTTLSTTAALSTVDLGRTFVTADFTSSGGGADIGARMIRAQLTNSTTLTIDRAVSGSPDTIELISWQVVELRDGSRVQSGSAAFANGTATVTPTLQAVDTSRASAFASVRVSAGLSAGRTDYVTDDILGVASATLTITSATQLTLTRANTGGATDIAWFVVEWGGAGWWNNNYALRRAITVTTTTAAAPADYTQSVTFDHAAMVSSGVAQADGDDVRVVYWNGSAWTELDRVLDDYSSWNSTTTKLWFKMPAAIGTSSTDGNFFLYYANPSAANPPANTANVHLFTDGFESGLANWNSWYDSNWQYRKKITLTAAQISGTQTDFPVLISTTDAALITKAQSDADDILFTAANGNTKLDHQIESFTPATGALVAWVRMPTLSSTSNVLYMYYGNAAASNQQNAPGVWDSMHTSVWHLSEAVSTGVDAFKDSKSVNHATYRGSPGMTQATGKANGSLTLDGTDDYLSTAVQQTDPQIFTVEAWFKTTVASGKPIVGFESTQTGTGAANYDRTLYIGTDGFAHFAVYDGTTAHVASGTTTLTDGAWHHIAGRYNVTTTNVHLFVDGVQRGSTTSSNAQSGNGYWRIGGYQASRYTAGVNGYFPGSVDEVRISNSGRGTPWILTNYNNQSNPAGFHTFSSEETSSGASNVYTVASDQIHSGTKALKVLPTAVAGNLLTAQNVAQADVQFDAWWRMSSTSSFDFAQSVRASASPPSNGYLGSISSTGYLRTGKDINGTFTAFDTAATNTCPGSGQWAKVSVLVVGTQMRVLCRNSGTSFIVGWSNTGSELSSGTVGFRTSAVPAGQNVWVDDVVARKLINPEPTASVGAADRA